MADVRRLAKLILTLRFVADRRGAAAMEFALIVPALLLALVGAIEVSVILFMGAAIEAAVFEASRFGVTGEPDTGMTREERVLSIVEERTYGLVEMSEVDIETLVYQSFADIGEPEPWTDDNANGAYDAGEDYTDVNGNGTWDPDMGAAGLGGPSDVVVYQVTYDWGVVTPILSNLLGESVRHVSSVALRNEPF